MRYRRWEMLGRNSYYVAGIVVRRRRTLEGLVIEVLVMNTQRGRKKVALVQFPGGMQKAADSSNPERTLRRELLEETSLRVKPEAEPLHLTTIVEKRHKKYFYLVRENDCDGTLRTQSIEDDTTILGPPYWLDIREFGKVCRTQRIILPFLEEELRNEALPTLPGPAV